MKIKVTGLNFSYEKSKQILHNIDFVVNKGDICCILGKNASGKTTLLKCINRVLEQNTGRILLDGKNVKELGRRELAKKIAYIPQEHRISLNYEVCDIVVMGRLPHLTMFTKPSDKDYRLAFNSLEKLNIEHLAIKNYNELSGGEKQLVLIARALTQQTEILLLDEPTSHLDFKHQHLIMTTIYEISRDKGLTVLLSMHDPNLAFKFCNRFVIIKNGKIINSGNTKKILTEKNIGNIYDMKIVIKTTNDNTKIILPE